MRQDIVGAPIHGDRAHLRARIRPRAEPVIDDVVFVQRVDGPPVDSDIGVAAGGSGFCFRVVRGEGS